MQKGYKMNTYNELPKTYSPSEFEDRIYQNWCEKGYFTPVIDKTKPSYTMAGPFIILSIPGFGES